MLKEMTARDWHIFQEDFNISYKGSQVPHAMQNWSEWLESRTTESYSKCGI
jgi:hypothetical protein